MSENAYSSPEAELLTASQETTSLTIKQILFSFEGRIARKTYWLSLIAASLIGGLSILTVIYVLGSLGVNDALLGVLALFFYIPFIWISLAIPVKRWHDRNKSGWWVLISIIPLIGPIWVFIENGCLPGDLESNDYGFPNS